MNGTTKRNQTKDTHQSNPEQGEETLTPSQEQITGLEEDSESELRRI